MVVMVVRRVVEIAEAIRIFLRKELLTNRARAVFTTRIEIATILGMTIPSEEVSWASLLAKP
jgi:hypothetical protein